MRKLEGGNLPAEEFEGAGDGTKEKLRQVEIASGTVGSCVTEDVFELAEVVRVRVDGYWLALRLVEAANVVEAEDVIGMGVGY